VSRLHSFVQEACFVCLGIFLLTFYGCAAAAALTVVALLIVRVLS